MLERDVLRDNPKALELFRQGAQLYPENRHFMREEALTYYLAQNFDEAEKKILAFIDLYPTDYAITVALIDLYIQKFVQYDKANELITKAKKQFPDSVFFYQQEANLLLQQQQFDAAQVKFEEIIQLNPKDPKAYYNLALLYFAKEEFAQSADICLKAIELDPNYLDAIYNVGTFYFLEGLTFNAAVSDMTVEQYQKQGDEFELEAIKFFDLAKPYFEKAISLNPDELDAYENLNTITVLLNNLNENRQIKQQAQATIAQNTNVQNNIQPLADLFVSNLTFVYPTEKEQKLKKGETGTIKFTLNNYGKGLAKNLSIITLMPVTIPNIEIPALVTADTLDAGKSNEFSILVTHLPNNSQTQGIKKPQGIENKIRIVITADGTNKTVMEEFVINLGEEIAAGDETVVVSETEDIDYFVPEPLARNFFFAIGIDEYKHWTKLNNAVSDVKMIKETLLSKYSFEPDFVFEIYNAEATQQGIRNELIKIKQQITANDNLLIYYAGHGYYDAEFDEGSWIPVDAQAGIETDYMANSRLVKYLDKIECKHMFVVADACFSGALFVRDNKVTYEAANDKIASRWALTSGNLEEVADGTAGTNSPFASSLVEFLQANKSSGIPVTELISYVSFKVKNATAETTRQTPIGKPLNVTGNLGGEYVIKSK